MRRLSLQALSLLGCFIAAASNDIIGIINGGGGGGSGGSGCRLVVEKNEWAAGCIPAVNFLVKLIECEGSAMSDITVRFVDENEKELGRDYFAAPSGQCTVSGYGNIKTITPRGGNSVFITASADLCGKTGGNIVSTQMPINGAVTDCF
ncbi:hypothetical protein ACHAXT_007928 [Thalassiosira profunda]